MLPSVLICGFVFQVQPVHQQTHGDKIAVRQARGDVADLLRARYLAMPSTRSLTGMEEKKIVPVAGDLSARRAVSRLTDVDAVRRFAYNPR